MREEFLLVKVQNFIINQRLVRIDKKKDAPYVDYTSQPIDAKMKLVLEKLNVVLNVTCS